MDIDLVGSILFATIRAGTPLLMVALGELVCEKTGVLNVGQEGMLLMGAVAGFIASFHSGSIMLGIAAATLAGIGMSLLFAVVVITLNANQMATGLALTIFGAGLSGFVGMNYTAETLQPAPALPIPGLSAVPLLGPALFSHDGFVYLSVLLCALVYCFLKYSRGGLVVKAIGESPGAAYAIGLPVLTARYLAVIFGGAMAGMAGAYLSLAYTPSWTENMTAGRGWIALALVVFASWRVPRLLLGAYLFGAAGIIHFILQGLNIAISSHLLASIPYVATILVLLILAADSRLVRLDAPASLGKPFRPGEFAAGTGI